MGDEEVQARVDSRLHVVWVGILVSGVLMISVLFPRLSDLGSVELPEFGGEAVVEVV